MSRVRSVAPGLPLLLTLLLWAAPAPAPAATNVALIGGNPQSFLQVADASGDTTAPAVIADFVRES